MPCRERRDRPRRTGQEKLRDMLRARQQLPWTQREALTPMAATIRPKRQGSPGRANIVHRSCMSADPRGRRRGPTWRNGDPAKFGSMIPVQRRHWDGMPAGPINWTGPVSGDAPPVCPEGDSTAAKRGANARHAFRRPKPLRQDPAPDVSNSECAVRRQTTMPWPPSPRSRDLNAPSGTRMRTSMTGRLMQK